MSHMLQSFTLGERAFNHHASQDAEREYDRLRDLARREFDREHDLRRQAREAGQRRDYGEKDRLHRQADTHETAAKGYNRQASEFIFRENNGQGKVQGDEIDLHGQYVEEALTILERRIEEDRSRNQSHLRVIVGKGNHSANHVQKLKPAVEQMLQKKGLQFHTEENAGRIFINLTGGAAVYPGPSGGQHGGQPGYPGAQHSGYQQQHAHQQRPPQQNDEVEKAVKKYAPKFFKALRGCCTVM